MQLFHTRRRLIASLAVTFLLTLPLNAYSYFYHPFWNFSFTTSVPVYLRGATVDPRNQSSGNWSNFAFIYVNFGAKYGVVNAYGYVPNTTGWFQSDLSKDGRHVFSCKSALNVFLGRSGTSLRAGQCSYAVWTVGLDQTPDIDEDNSAYCFQSAGFRL